MSNNLHVSREEFLKPLFVIKQTCELQGRQIDALRMETQRLLTKIEQQHLAIPSHMRSRHLFLLEDKINKVCDSFVPTEQVIKRGVDAVRLVAKDVIGIDPIFREDALQLVRSSELLLEGLLDKLQDMRNEADHFVSRMQIAG